MPGRARGGTLDVAIRAAAWDQITRFGAVNLSLRAIARELGVTAPAIYHYFPSRDELVTALIVEAFSSFGDAQFAALEAAPATDLPARLTALGVAYRDWAVGHPEQYQLIFGAPIPGYQPPKDRIMPPGIRALRALVGVVADLHAAGALNVEGVPAPAPDQDWSVQVWRANAGEVAEVCLAVAISIWARVHGLVSLEISGRIPRFGRDGDALYRHELAELRRQYLNRPDS